MAERTCIVTRKVTDPDLMIRFVADPEGKVVADIKNRLPGRGVWVTAHRQMVEKAVTEKLFPRGFKRTVTVSPDLADQVDGLLTEAALGGVKMAKKAGDCSAGAFQVQAALEKGRVLALLHATDAASDGIRKLAGLARQWDIPDAPRLPDFRLFDSVQLSLALGGTNVIHAALNKGGAAQNAVRHLARIAKYRNEGTGSPAS